MYELGQKLKQQLIERAAQQWDVEVGQVKYENGVFATDGQRLTFKELAAAAAKESATLEQLATTANADPLKLRQQIAAVGKACGACHEAYRARKD